MPARPPAVQYKAVHLLGNRRVPVLWKHANNYKEET
jgi:hypothetical protein